MNCVVVWFTISASCTAKGWQLYGFNTKNIYLTAGTVALLIRNYAKFQLCFHVTAQCIREVAMALALPYMKTTIHRNQYITSVELTTLIILRLLKSSCCWTDLVSLFQIHSSHLGEICWVGLQQLYHACSHLLCDDLSAVTNDAYRRSHRKWLCV